MLWRRGQCRFDKTGNLWAGGYMGTWVCRAPGVPAMSHNPAPQESASNAARHVWLYLQCLKVVNLDEVARRIATRKDGTVRSTYSYQQGGVPQLLPPFSTDLLNAELHLHHKSRADATLVA